MKKTFLQRQLTRSHSMKRLLVLTLLLSLCGLLCACGKDSELTTVRLNEVAHSIFYAPQYAAIELGYFDGVPIGGWFSRLTYLIRKTILKTQPRIAFIKLYLFISAPSI